MTEQINTPTWQREQLKSRLAELCELDAVDQAQALGALRQRDPTLAAELESLLGFAAQALPSLGAAERMLGSLNQVSLPERFGPWEVLGELGRGGMGVVLRARRSDGAFDKEVAIKILPPLLAGAQNQQRFVQEARVLAQLDHPHIARLIDAGVEQGCAYFVMELVDGLPITHYFRRHAAAQGLRERLDKFLQLSSAAAFAHSRLLIHRDIKPANVLIDRQGRVRLLDFGIAKLLNQEPLTQASHQIAFTPAYASPEQIQGEPASVAGDVFSLGVLLYELCCDAHPFLKDAGDTGSHTSPHTTPHTAATLLAMIEQPIDHQAMKRAQLPADLQAVLRKALQKDPTLRYSSVDAFSADVEAFLGGHPVKAQAPSWSYQTAKFVRRNWGAVSTAALTALAIVGLSLWSLHSAQVARTQTALAEKRLASVREIANKVVFDYNRALEPINGTLELRKTLVSDALGYLEAQAQDAGEDQGLKSEIARGFQAIGDVQGRGVTASNLGQVAAAQASYAKAFALRQAVCQAAPQLRVAVDATTSVPACAAQANAMMAQADNHFAAGQAPKAIEAMQAARQINAQALSGLPAGDPARLPVLRQQFNLNHRVAGLSLRQSGQAYAQGLALAQANLPLAEELSQALAQTRPPGADKANPALQASQVHLRDANDFLSNRLLASGQAQNALAPMQTALSLSRAAHAAEPTGANAVYVMVSLSQRAEIHLHLNQLVQAEADALQALALARQTHLADPQNALFKARYANIGRRTGALLNQIGSPAAHSLAQSLLAQVANVSASFTPQDGVFWHQHQLVVVQQAQAALALGQVQTAQRLLAMFASQGADNPRAALDLTDAYLLRAKAAAAAGQAEDSKAALALALAPLQARAQSTPADVMTRANLADACQWALNQSAFSADHAQHRACVQAQVRDLAQAQQLTPWWRKRLAAFLPA